MSIDWPLLITMAIVSGFFAVWVAGISDRIRRWEHTVSELEQNMNETSDLVQQLSLELAEVKRPSARDASARARKYWQERPNAPTTRLDGPWDQPE